MRTIEYNTGLKIIVETEGNVNYTIIAAGIRITGFYSHNDIRKIHCILASFVKGHLFMDCIDDDDCVDIIREYISTYIHDMLTS